MVLTPGTNSLLKGQFQILPVAELLQVGELDNAAPRERPNRDVFVQRFFVDVAGCLRHDCQTADQAHYTQRDLCSQKLPSIKVLFDSHYLI